MSVLGKLCLLLGLLLLQRHRHVHAIDGQSFKASDEDIERLYNDPMCERTRGSQKGIDWDSVRSEFDEAPFPTNMPLVKELMDKLEQPGGFDREAQVCPSGVVSVLFYFVKFLIERDEPILGAAKVYFSILDDYSSMMHPSLLDKSGWLVKDRRINSVRDNLLSKLRAKRLDKDATTPKTPRIYVYTDSDVSGIKKLTQGVSFCGKGQWGMEVHIHDWLMVSPHRTLDPAEADLFFVPAYSICMFEAGLIPMPELDKLYTDVVRELPFFKFNNGRDHVFTFGSGLSANVFRSWKSVIPDAIFLTPETWLFNDVASDEPCFNTWKDIAIPGYLHRSEIISLTERAKPLSKREHFAVFLGRVDPSRGPHPTSDGQEPDVRRALARLHAEGKIFVAQNLSFQEMHAAMGNSKYCFVPKGKSAWSLRFYEALFANCVPVVLSDKWELPFEDFLDIPSSVIKWPMGQVGDEMLEALQNVDDSVLKSYMENGRKLRCWYAYPALLHEVHLSRDAADALETACPDIATTNAFEGLFRLLAKKRRVSWTFDRHFGPRTS